MSTFLTTSNGFINAEHIVEIIQRRRAGYLARLVDGESRELSAKDEESLLHQLNSLVPAHSGFELLTAWPEDGEPGGFFERDPIVAWCANDFGGVTPITPASNDLPSSGLTAIRYPDGQIEVPFDRRFTNETDWQEYALKCMKTLQSVKKTISA